MLIFGLHLTLLGCRMGGDDFVRTPTLPEIAAPEVTPPPAAGPGETRLFQLLYAGESGAPAHALGQRVRVRAWLDVMALDAAQIEGLRALVRTVRGLEAEERVAKEALAAREFEAYAPIYAELDARLQADERVPDAELATFGERLSAARLLAQGDTPALSAERTRVQTLLDAAAAWIGTLPPVKAERLAQSRFFLAKRVSPLGNVADYQALVGLNWDGGDFSAIDATGAAATQPQMDIGGLWALEKMRAPPGGYLVARQLQAIVVMAVLEPALGEVLGVEAIEVAAAP